MNLRFRFIVLYVVLAGMATYMNFHRDLVVPLARPFGEFPPVHAGWRMAGQSSLSQNVIKVLMPTDYLSRRYMAEDGTRVDMYLSYFDGGPNSGGIHSPKHCMPGSGWFEMSSERTTMELGGETVKLVRAVYAMGEQRELIYYWFDMRGRTMSDEYSLKLAAIMGSMFHNRRDQSFIRISVQTRNNVEEAQKWVENFLRDFYPVIREFLPG
ncbi:MAG: exosortase C-terminal domain/associated protein EpsI [Desulfomicrobium sp.]